MAELGRLACLSHWLQMRLWINRREEREEGWTGYAPLDDAEVVEEDLTVTDTELQLEETLRKLHACEKRVRELEETLRRIEEER
jgi:hypothetical protein